MKVLILFGLIAAVSAVSFVDVSKEEWANFKVWIFYPFVNIWAQKFYLKKNYCDFFLKIFEIFAYLFSFFLLSQFLNWRFKFLAFTKKTNVIGSTYRYLSGRNFMHYLVLLIVINSALIIFDALEISAFCWSYDSNFKNSAIGTCWLCFIWMISLKFYFTSIVIGNHNKISEALIMWVSKKHDGKWFTKKLTQP